MVPADRTGYPVPEEYRHKDCDKQEDQDLFKGIFQFHQDEAPQVIIPDTSFEWSKEGIIPVRTLSPHKIKDLVREDPHAKPEDAGFFPHSPEDQPEGKENDRDEEGVGENPACPDCC